MLQDPQSQVENQQNLNPDEAAASLAFSTNLMQQMMPKNPQVNEGTPIEAPQGPEMAENSEDIPKPQEMPMHDEMGAKMADLEAKFDGLEKDVKKTIKDEIGGIKEMIKQALSEDEE